MGMMEEMFRRMAEEAVSEERGKPKPLPEAVLMDLKEAAARYVEPCRFKVGDVVTAIKGGDTKGQGEPHVVIDTLENPQPIFVGQPGSNAFGQRFDMRVIHRFDDKITTHWVESAGFEPWVGASQ